MNLSDIRGQDAAVRALSACIRKSSVAQAYLFTGPRNSGKTSVALAFAAALNCTDRTPEGYSCGKCISCLRIEAGTDADVRVISPDGNQTKMDQMQEMIKDLSYAPISGRYKVFIIEQADTLNSSSENSILKILEEPPSYAVLILLSRNPNSLLPTIRSRCRALRFRRASTEEVASVLSERFPDLSADETRIIAACSQGAIGAALSMASEPRFLEDRQAILHSISNWAAGHAMLSLQTAELLREMARPPKNNPESQTVVKNLTSILEITLSWYSDLLCLSVSGESAPLNNDDFRTDLIALSARYSAEHLRRGIRSIMEARRYLEGNITPQLVLENMLFELHPISGID